MLVLSDEDMHNLEHAKKKTVQRDDSKEDCFCLYCPNANVGWCKEAKRWCYMVKNRCQANRFYLDHKNINKRSSKRGSKFKK